MKKLLLSLTMILSLPCLGGEVDTTAVMCMGLPGDYTVNWDSCGHVRSIHYQGVGNFMNNDQYDGSKWWIYDDQGQLVQYIYTSESKNRNFHFIVNGKKKNIGYPRKGKPFRFYDPFLKKSLEITPDITFFGRGIDYHVTDYSK